MGKNFDQDDESNFSIQDPRKPFSKTNCSTNQPDYLSDLRYHYQFQIPAVFRGCTRYAIGIHFDLQSQGIYDDFVANRKGEAQTIEALRRASEDDLRFAISFCRANADLSAVPPETLKGYKVFMDGKKLEYLRSTFEMFYRSQARSLPGGIEVNVFDYIMSSGPFDLDYEQQQAVLNEFYGDLAKNQISAKGAGAFDPADPRQCAELREPRPFMDQKDGTHCLASTPKLYSLYSSGR